MKAGIPVVSINSGSDVARRIGTLAHVGQPEEKAGFEAGRRLVAAGAGTATRCASTRRSATSASTAAARASRARSARPAARRACSPSTPRTSRETRRRVAEASSEPGVDAVLALNNTGGEIAADVVPRDVADRHVRLHRPTVLRAIRSGRIEFAVDQQPYLQGYLPVVFLAERARYGLFPAQGEVVPTGPNFITALQRRPGRAAEPAGHPLRT